MKLHFDKNDIELDRDTIELHRDNEADDKQDGWGHRLCDDWLAMHAEVKRLRKATTWQPMDTAPRDGTEVLLRVEMRAGIPDGALVGHYMPGGHCIGDDHPPINEGWYFWNGCMFDKASEPIHWMPLLEAAETKGGE